MFESLKKKFSGTVGKISDKFSEDEIPSGETLDNKNTECEVTKGKKTPKKVKPTPKTSKGIDTPKTTTTPEKETFTRTISEDETVASTENEKTSRFYIFRRKTGEKSESFSETAPKMDESEDHSPESEKKSPENEPGIFGFATHKTISEDYIEDILFELELSLLEGDVALEVAEKIIKSVESDLVGRKIKRRSDVSQYTQEAL
ncbi:MAG: signal recognition particle receptor subunit alpha, partial [Methanobacteriaceae archaeon]|nr:signal recognition particle receptor subunit alpha [Methanobacteriaceae archaeon]